MIYVFFLETPRGRPATWHSVLSASSDGIDGRCCWSSSSHSDVALLKLMLSDINLTFLTCYLLQHIYSSVLLDTGKQYSLTFQLDQVEGSMISSLLLWAHCVCLFLHLFLSQLSLRKWPCPKFIFLLLLLFLPLPLSPPNRLPSSFYACAGTCCFWTSSGVLPLFALPLGVSVDQEWRTWPLEPQWPGLHSCPLKFTPVSPPSLFCFPAASRKISHSSWLLLQI